MPQIVIRDQDAFSEMVIKKGFSLRGLAKAADISSPYISQIIRGERNPSAKIARKLCDALEVDFDTLFFIRNACKSEHIERA